MSSTPSFPTPASQFATLYVTASSREEAGTLSKAAVEASLTACANIIAIDSVYRWEGKLCQEPEVAILFKTRAGLTDRLMAFIAARHSYDCPCMVVLPWQGVHQPYADWVAGATEAVAED